MKRKIRWFVTTAIVGMHVAAGYGIYYGIRERPWFTLSAWIWFFIMWRLSAVGISIGYHRYFTHHSFKCSPWLQRTLCALGLISWEGKASNWVWDHSQHHRFAELPGDPHRPEEFPGLKGFLWSHILWLFFTTERPKGFEASPLADTPIARWENIWWLPVMAGSLLFPLLVAGWPGFWLAGCIRIVFVWHLTWSVNSFCHIFGKATDQFGRSRSGTQSRNNHFFILFDWIGEGWHRNHHEQPNCAYLGWRWNSPDIGRWTIRSLEVLGIVWDVKKPIHQPGEP